MPYCPNPECPYRKRFGESAEYRSEITTCSDCGSLLDEKDILGPLPKKKSNFILTETQKRVLWTLALVGFWRILSHLSLPGIDLDALSRLTGGRDSPSAQFVPTGIFFLGLIAYVSAYVLVEIASLFVQPFKRWRVDGGPEGRAKLVSAARRTTLVIAVYHASALVTTMAGVAGGSLLRDNGLGSRSLLVLTLVAGLFLTVWIADMISAKGIGHGVSILFLTSDISGLPRKIYQWLHASQGDNRTTQVFIPLLLLAGLVMLIIAAERTVRRISFRRTDGTDVFVPVKLTTAGTTPVEWAGWVFGLPALILAVFPYEKQAEQHFLQLLAGNIAPQSLGRIVVYGIVVIVFYYVFTAFFHNPRKISGFINRTEDDGTLSSDAIRAVDRSLEGMALVGSLYLLMLSFVQDALWVWFGIPLLINGLTLLLVVCITLDLVNEVRLRWRTGSLVKIAEFHEPWKAGLMQNVLEGKSIPSVIRGYHHRALLYFFGPYIEMSLYVPREQAEVAQEVVNDFSART